MKSAKLLSITIVFMCFGFYVCDCTFNDYGGRCPSIEDHMGNYDISQISCNGLQQQNTATDNEIANEKIQIIGKMNLSEKSLSIMYEGEQGESWKSEYSVIGWHWAMR